MCLRATHVRSRGSSFFEMVLARHTCPLAAGEFVFRDGAQAQQAPDPRQLVLRNDAFKTQSNARSLGGNLKKQEKNNFRGRILGASSFCEPSHRGHTADQGPSSSLRVLSPSATPDASSNQRRRTALFRSRLQGLARISPQVLYRTKREQSQDLRALFARKSRTSGVMLRILRKPVRSCGYRRAQPLGAIENGLHGRTRCHLRRRSVAPAKKEASLSAAGRRC
jgi:hypothetical protein